MTLAIDTETHAEMQRQLADAEADGERLSAENAKLRAALKPFADSITRAEKDEPDSPEHRLECCRTDVTLYEFAKARDALKPER